MKIKEDKNTEFMRLALKLAKKAEGMTSPNPLVGAVLVKRGKVIGKGYHKRAGLAHAEIDAIRDAEKRGQKIRGSTLYVNLEPCCHRDKRTPPCTDSIIESGISKVFVGAYDPNPKVCGKGVSILREANVDVEVGLLGEEAKKVNQFFFKYINEKMPYVVLKLASTLDGKIATVTGDSKWIGSTRQREMAHHLRNKMDCVIVGINTVIKDNPNLNVRIQKRNLLQPVPVVLDSKLRISPDSNVFKVHKNCIIAALPNSSKRKKMLLERAGATILYSDTDESGKMSLKSILGRLAGMEFTTVLIEGGSKVASSALREGVVDKIVFFYCPKIVGGDGMSMISDLAIKDMNDALS